MSNEQVLATDRPALSKDTLGQQLASIKNRVLYGKSSRSIGTKRAIVKTGSSLQDVLSPANHPLRSFVGLETKLKEINLRNLENQDHADLETRPSPAKFFSHTKSGREVENQASILLRTRSNLVHENGLSLSATKKVIKPSFIFQDQSLRTNSREQTQTNASGKKSSQVLRTPSRKVCPVVKSHSRERTTSLQRKLKFVGLEDVLVKEKPKAESQTQPDESGRLGLSQKLEAVLAAKESTDYLKAKLKTATKDKVATEEYGLQNYSHSESKLPQDNKCLMSGFLQKHSVSNEQSLGSLLLRKHQLSPERRRLWLQQPIHQQSTIDNCGTGFSATTPLSRQHNPKDESLAHSAQKDAENECEKSQLPVGETTFLQGLPQSPGLVQNVGLDSTFDLPPFPNGQPTDLWLNDILR